MDISLIRQKLDEQILDFAFFSSGKILQSAPEILEILLQEEKEKFAEKFTLPNTELTFDSLEEESPLSTFFGLVEHFNSVESNDILRKIIEDFEPKYVAWGNEVAYSKEYFQLLQKLLEKGNLDTDQKRILDESIKNYRIRGIDLVSDQQDKLKKINQELALLQQKFSNNVLDAEAEFSYLIRDENILSEMPEDDKEVAKKKAVDTKNEGWLFDASWSSYASVMTYCSDEPIRKHFYTEKNRFATSGQYDNREIILNILKLRGRKAQILGYSDYASYSFEHKMAGSPREVIDLIEKTALKAKEKADIEIATLKEYFSLSEIDYWDTSYYLRKYKKDIFNFDEKSLRNYFELESTLSGMFSIATQLFGVNFKEVSSFEIKKYHPDICLYEVYKDGILKAYLLGDYYHRAGKRPGAWANNIRSKFFHHGKQKLPIIVNIGNFQKSIGETSLLPLRDVETMFHEFGHALHEMLSESHYAELSGFGVELDFVELPSQLMENWCSDKTSLDLFARHMQDGSYIPQEIIDTMKASAKFGKGLFLLRQNEFSYLDMLLHTSKTPNTVHDLDIFIQSTVSKFAVFSHSPDYKQYATFHHLFDGGYAAGYYSYMWSEIIEAQVWDVFKKEGVMNIQVGKKYYDTILRQGSRKDGIDLLHSFTGTGIDIQAFLERYGIEES